MKKIIILLASIAILVTLQIETTAQTVYVSRHGKDYHSLSCNVHNKSLRGGGKLFAIELSEAVRLGYTPCNKCDAPRIIKVDANNNPVFNPNENDKNLKEVVVVRCQAINKNGKQCKNNALPGSTYCKKHKG